jgi:hypothetical protein
MSKKEDEENAKFIFSDMDINGAGILVMVAIGAVAIFGGMIMRAFGV